MNLPTFYPSLFPCKTTSVIPKFEESTVVLQTDAGFNKHDAYGNLIVSAPGQENLIGGSGAVILDVKLDFLGAKSCRFMCQNDNNLTELRGDVEGFKFFKEICSSVRRVYYMTDNEVVSKIMISETCLKADTNPSYKLLFDDLVKYTVGLELYVLEQPKQSNVKKLFSLVHELSVMLRKGGPPE